MDAKKALTETDGDMDAAVDWLRTKGLAKAAKKSGRTAAEGLVAVASEGGTAVAVEVNSETDFVAKNAEFQEMVSGIAQAALGVEDLAGLLEAEACERQDRRADRHRQRSATIGENIDRAPDGPDHRRQRGLLHPQRGGPRHGQDRRSGGLLGR